ncbi:MAG: extracellular solute-binding protein [Chloroflexi bacterium]|nr:extracellular solute-binding protein [Chloroflexota bacterium]MBV9546507.1 extracellular solute-binding protein [Chloroflexota bacterium]
MRTRRDVLKAALGTMAVLVATACGTTPAAAPTTAPAAAPTPPPAAKPTTAPAAGAATSAPTTAAAAPTAAGAAPAAKPTAPANLGGATVNLLQWNHFIPTADPFFKQQAADWAGQTGVNVTIETINANDLTPRFTAAIQGQSGPTIFQMQYLAPHSFAEGLYDLSDLANQIQGNFGKFYDQINTSATVDGKYRAVPYAIFGNAFVYRKDYFQQAGASVPQTWDDFHDVVKKMAGISKPVGQTFAQTFGDAPTFFYPLLWAYGGKEVEDDGKTVAINSEATVAAVTFAKQLWTDGLDQRAASWDDSGNNTAFLADEISCTLNGASIYFVGAGLDGKTPPKPWADQMDHFLPPKGPSAQVAWFLDHTHGIPTYVKGKDLDASKEFIKWFMDPAQYDQWFELQKGYTVGPGTRLEQNAMWDSLPKALAPFRTAGRIARALGYSGQPTPQTNEVFAKYVVVNMFARAAVQGMSPQESVAQAEAEMKQIYSS